MAEFKVGQTVETTDGRKAVIRYIGEINAAPGQFLGIELPDATGKNDGSVKGERYFDCPLGHGLFVRPAGISRVIAQPAPPPAKPVPSPTKSIASPTKPTASRQSISRAPKPGPRPSSIGGLPKGPTKPTSSTNRLSIAPPSQQASSKAPVRKSSVSTASTTSTTKPLSRPSSIAPRAAPSAVASSAGSKPTKAPQPKSADVDGLETKIRHLEKQVAENREQLKQLDTVRGEKVRYEGIVQKLQAKCQTFHSEIGDLKSRLKEAEVESERLSKNEAEHESILELATLDREMAEERADQAEVELESLKQRLEEQALELDILNSERDLLTNDMSEEEKQAAGYYRLQNENDRLKEALIRLREITEESEADLKHRIRELEADQAQTDQLREEKNALAAQLSMHEASIDDLRQQVDAANAWEDIIEDLSDQNQQFKDQLADKDIVIKDLENLKELNDELEIHHIEQANELRVELEAREIELAEQTQRITEQDAAIADQEMLITKFRDLVLDLQSKMTDAESSKMMSEEQAKDVTGRFNEVMELNRRLRSANLTSTVKTIVSELQKLQAEEAEEELEIVKHYLPDSPEVYKNDSLRAYFRAKRVSFKSALCASLVTISTVQSSSPEDTEHYIDNIHRLDGIHHLNLLHSRSEQFWSAINSSTVEQFVAFGSAYEELSPVEKSLERCIEAMKKDELKYTELSDSIRRSYQILNGVTADFHAALANRPEDEIIFRVSSIKSSFEAIRATFDSLRSTIQSMDTEDGEWDNGSQNLLERLMKPASESNESIVSAGKLLKTLETLRNDSLYPHFPLGIEDVVKQEELVRRTAQAAHDFATKFTQFILTFHGESTPVLASELSKHMNSLQETHFLNDELLEIGNVVAKLNFWDEHASVLMNNVEIEHGAAPWVLKAGEIEAAKKLSAEAEKKLQILTVEHHSTVLQIRERDEIIETKELEIEHLKAKHREAATKNEDLARIQNELRGAQKDRERYQLEIKSQQAELQRLKDRTSLSEYSETSEPRATTPAVDAPAPAENALPKVSTPATFITFVDALQNENHWLRRRENKEMFGHNLKMMFAKIRDFQLAEARKEARHKQKKADEMLAMTLSMVKSELTPETPASSYMQTPPTPESKTTNPSLKLIAPSIRRNRAPIFLTPLQSPLNWMPDASTPRHYYEDMEDEGFQDLSPIAEDFATEMEEALEGFSELGDVTVNGIMERATWRS